MNHVVRSLYVEGEKYRIVKKSHQNQTMESRVRCFLYGCLVVEYQISGYPLWRRSFLAMSRPSYSVRYLCTVKASKKISWCFSLSESPSFDQFHKNRPIKSNEGPSFEINSAKYIYRVQPYMNRAGCWK